MRADYSSRSRDGKRQLRSLVVVWFPGYRFKNKELQPRMDANNRECPEGRIKQKLSSISKSCYELLQKRRGEKNDNQESNALSSAFDGAPCLHRGSHPRAVSQHGDDDRRRGRSS